MNRKTILFVGLILLASLSPAVNAQTLEFNTGMFSNNNNPNNTSVVVGTTTVDVSFQSALLQSAQVRLENLLYYIRNLDNPQTFIGAQASTTNPGGYSYISDIAFTGETDTVSSTDTPTLNSFFGTSVETASSASISSTQQTSPGDSQCPVFTENLTIGASSGQVLRLQQLLNRFENSQVSATGAGAPGSETSYFGVRTRAAVLAFQAQHRTEVLTPVGLSAPTGFWGPATRAYANVLVGCSSASADSGQ